MGLPLHSSWHFNSSPAANGRDLSFCLGDFVSPHPPSCFISKIIYPFLPFHQDHPEHGVLFLVRELLNVIQDYTWEDNGDDKIRIYTCVLHLLSAMSQETYLYHIDKGSGVPSYHHYTEFEFHISPVKFFHCLSHNPLVFFPTRNISNPGPC